jgi:putative pyrroloquinoline-quinone-binding quinoprotein
MRLVSLRGSWRFCHDDTSIRAVNRNGDLLWEYVVGTPVKTAPVITGNLLLIHDFAGNLWCFAGTESCPE